MSWMAPASETVALRVGGEFALLLYKGVRSRGRDQPSLGRMEKSLRLKAASADTDVSVLLPARGGGAVLRPVWGRPPRACLGTPPARPATTCVASGQGTACKRPPW